MNGSYLISLCLISCTYCDRPSELIIGAVLPANSSPFLVEAFRLAIDNINSDSALLPDTKLVSLVEEANDKFDIIRAVCQLVDKRIVSLVGPLTSSLSRTAQVICGQLGIPQISIIATDPMLSLIPVSSQPLSTHLKMSPPDTYQNQALVSLVKYFGWTKMALLTEESEDVLHGVMDFQRLVEANDWTVVTVRRFQYNSDGIILDLTSHLEVIWKKNVRLIVLDCSSKYSQQVMDEAHRLGMMNRGWVWLVTDRITSHDTQYMTENGKVSHSFRGILGTALIVPNSTMLRDILNGLKNEVNDNEPNQKQVIGRIYDGVLTVAHGLNQLLYVQNEQFEPPTFSEGTCRRSNVTTWNWGRRLFNSIYSIEGASGCLGPLKFTKYGFHHELSYDIVNFQPEGLKRVGIWNGSTLQMTSDVMFPGPETDPPKDYYYSLYNKTLVVGVTQVEPFLMRNEQYNPNDPQSLEYEGLLIDLFLELQKRHKFMFSTKEYKEFGYKNSTTKIWNGLTKALIDKEIDIALATFTISSERQEVISFTKPFYDLGLSILMPKKNSAAQKPFFAFLSPFDAGVWCLILATMVFASLALAICNNLVPRNFDNQRNDKQSTSYRITLPQAFWWGFSSLVNPGTEIGKANLPSRIVMASWWLTTVVLVAAYTAKLAAAMTVQHMNQGIESLEELIASKNIEFGTLSSSQARYFFSHSEYGAHQIAHKMMTKNNWFVETNEEGIRRVRESYHLPEGNPERYAYISDLPALEYAANQEPCNIEVIGRPFALQNYGLGLAKDSPYESQLSVTILQLRESGFMYSLTQKWFTGSCSERKIGGSEEQQLGIWNLIGVFSCFFGGIVLAFFLMIFYWMKEITKQKKTVDHERAVVICRSKRCHNNKDVF